MDFDVKNLVIDRCKRLTGFRKDGTIKYSLTQVQDLSLAITGDQTDAVDNVGTTIMSFQRAKTATLSGSNALFDIALLAAQSGTEVQVATATKKFLVPFADYIDVTTADTATLTRIPVVMPGDTFAVKVIAKINGDDTIGQQFTAAAVAATGEFSLAGKIATFEAGEVNVGDKLYALYWYEADDTANNSAVMVEANAKDWALPGQVIGEIVAFDPCDEEQVIGVIVDCPSGRLSVDADLTFGTEMEHPFEIQLSQKYCDSSKVLFRVYVPEAALIA